MVLEHLVGIAIGTLISLGLLWLLGKWGRVKWN